MAIEKKGFNPLPQKKNPKGKYNDKQWIKVGAKDMVDIDQIDMLIYNNMDISISIWQSNISVQYNLFVNG